MSSKFPTPLSKRFRDNGKAAFYLSDVQREARDSVLAKIRNGEYVLEDVRCPVCASSNRHTITERDAYAIPVAVTMCNDCHFIYTGRRMALKSLGNFYNVEYRRIERGVPLPREEFFNLQHGKGLAIQEYLRSVGIDLDRNGIVVEVGCGAGGILEAFREHGHTVIGCDLGREYVEYGANRHGLDLYTGDLESLKPFIASTNRRVTLIIYEQTFEHLMDLPAELASIRPLMDANSFLFIGVPGIRNVDAHYDSDFLKYLQPGHTSHFDLASLTYWLDKGGFARVAGDERVRAVFRLTSPLPDRRDAQGIVLEDIRPFLMGVERRWRSKAIRDIPRRAVVSARVRLARVLRRAASLLPKGRHNGA